MTVRVTLPPAGIAPKSMYMPYAPSDVDVVRLDVVRLWMLENDEPEYELAMMPTDDASSASRYRDSHP